MKNKKIMILMGVCILHSLQAFVGPWREEVLSQSENYADDANVVIQGARSSGMPGSRNEVEIQFMNECPNCLPEVAVQSLEKENEDETQVEATESADKTINTQDQAVLESDDAQTVAVDLTQSSQEDQQKSFDIKESDQENNQSAPAVSQDAQEKPTLEQESVQTVAVSESLNDKKEEKELSDSKETEQANAPTSTQRFENSEEQVDLAQDDAQTVAISESANTQTDQQELSDNKPAEQENSPAITVSSEISTEIQKESEKPEELLQEAVESSEKLHELAQESSLEQKSENTVIETKPEPSSDTITLKTEQIEKAPNSTHVENPVVVEKIVYVYPVYERLEQTAVIIKNTGKELWNFIVSNVQKVMQK